MQKVLKCVWIFNYVVIAQISLCECIQANIYLPLIFKIAYNKEKLLLTLGRARLGPSSLTDLGLPVRNTASNERSELKGVGSHSGVLRGG